MSNHNERSDERSPLLPDAEQNGSTRCIAFSKDDNDDPRKWPKHRKMVNVAIISLMAILSPLASAMFTPGMQQIADSFGVTADSIVGATTGYVVMLGIGPLVLAPLSETFGRRRLYIVCFGVFTVLQVPTALSPNLATLLVCRTLAGFFGSVGIANGGGTIKDMFVADERAGVFGWYLLGPLLGPTIGPLLGGIVVQFLSWRWVFWILAIICFLVTAVSWWFLRETLPSTILQSRAQQLEKEDGGHYTYEGQDSRPLFTKLARNIQRPLKILFTQPIVFIMATYQAIIYATMYTLFTNMQATFSEAPYNFSTLQVGLLYLGPGSGFLVAVWFIVPQIDVVYKQIAERHHTEPKPEYRLPLANIGSFLLPVTIFWFAWTVEYRLYWLVPILATPFFGLGQVVIFNTLQNYYIDSFSDYAASAIAAGAIFRSVVGGVVPLMAPALFGRLGYGWGWSVFGFAALLLTPSPMLFMRFGERLRERYRIEL